MGNHRRRGRRYGAYRRPKYNVPVNIIEKGDGFEAHVYATGFSREQIRITVSHDVLYITGKREPAEEYPNFLLQEYPIKSFERWFELSDSADQKRITANMQEGVLVIRVPKTPEASRPDIEVDIQ